MLEVITQQEARKLALNCQGLLSEFNDTLAVIQQIGYVQIDTISVTERAHHHVLFTRNHNYKKEEITQLMNDQLIFEYWSHAAAYLPMEDFRFSLTKKESYRKGNKHWFPRDKKVEQYVMDRIKAEGPLQSKDFENPRSKNHEWYEWKPAKIALTNLFMDGSLMIANRQGFQKIFDLTENVIPSYVNTSTPSIEESCRHLIFNSIKAHGVVTLNEIVYLRKGIKTIVNKLLNQMIEYGELVKVKVENNEDTYFSSQRILEELENIRVDNKIHFLSPFDNLVIQRKRLKELFNFDYIIECYVPESKRVFGYYTIPILYRNEFVGRFDAKADRKTNTFTVKQIWYEKGFNSTSDFKEKFDKQLKSFANFCGCANH